MSNKLDSHQGTLNNSFFEFIRFGATGVLSLLIFVAASNLLFWMGVPMWISTVTAWILSSTASYFGHIHFSYKVEADHERMSWKFIVMLGFHFLLTLAITYILTDLVHLEYSITTVITACLTPLATYPMGKFWVFKEAPVKTAD